MAKTISLKTISNSSQTKEYSKYPLAIFLCFSNPHNFVDRHVVIKGKVKIGRQIACSKDTEDSCLFECKVLSKNHALLWYDNGKFFLKDTKSSNGTFLNEQRLSPELTESDDYEIFTNDVVQFGVDVFENPDKLVHDCIIALLKLYHADGTETCVRPQPISLSNFNELVNVSAIDLFNIRSFINMALYQENILNTKLSELNNKLNEIQEVTQQKWRTLIEEEILLSKIEILQKKLETFSSSNLVLKSNDFDKCVSFFINKVKILQDEKESYAVQAKEIIKDTLDKHTIAVNKAQELELKLSFSSNECKKLEELIESLKIEIFDLVKKIVELTNLNKEYSNFQIKEKHPDENISESKRELQKKQNQINLHENSYYKSSQSQSGEKLKDEKREIVPENGTIKECSLETENFLNNINLQNEFHLITELHKIIDFYVKQILDSSHNTKDIFKLTGLFIAASKNKLILQNEYYSKSNSNITNFTETNSASSMNYVHIKNVKNINKTYVDMFMQIFNLIEKLNEKSNHCLNFLTDKKSELNKSNKLVEKLNLINFSLKNKIGDYEKDLIEIRKKLELVENEKKSNELQMSVELVLNSVIGDVERSINNENLKLELDKNEIKNDVSMYEDLIKKLRYNNENLNAKNESLILKMNGLKDNYENVSYQNKIAYLLALIPIIFLFVSIILAYLPFLQVVTGTNEL